LIRVQEVYNDHKVIRYINLGRELKKQRELAAATKEEEKKKREEEGGRSPFLPQVPSSALGIDIDINQ